MRLTAVALAVSIGSCGHPGGRATGRTAPPPAPPPSSEPAGADDDDAPPLGPCVYGQYELEMVGYSVSGTCPSPITGVDPDPPGPRNFELNAETKTVDAVDDFGRHVIYDVESVENEPCRVTLGTPFNADSLSQLGGTQTLELDVDPENQLSASGHGEIFNVENNCTIEFTDLIYTRVLSL